MFVWGKRFVRLVCSYELLALPERSPLPTITTLTHANRAHTGVKALVWAVLGVLCFHLLFEKDSRFSITG